MDRARTYEFLQQWALAQSDLDQARDVNDTHAYRGWFVSRPYAFEVGILQWAKGDLEGAVNSFGLVAHKHAFYPYLWRIIASGADPGFLSDLGDASNDADLTEWPGPIVKFFLGKITGDDLLAAAQVDSAAREPQICEAHFYLAEWEKLHHKPDSARAEFATAVHVCPSDYIELFAATMELSRHQDTP